MSGHNDLLYIFNVAEDQDSEPSLRLPIYPNKRTRGELLEKTFNSKKISGHIYEPILKSEHDGSPRQPLDRRDSVSFINDRKQELADDTEGVIIEQSSDEVCFFNDPEPREKIDISFPQLFKNASGPQLQVNAPALTVRDLYHEPEELKSECAKQSYEKNQKTLLDKKLFMPFMVWFHVSYLAYQHPHNRIIYYVSPQHAEQVYKRYKDEQALLPKGSELICPHQDEEGEIVYRKVVGTGMRYKKSDMSEAALLEHFKEIHSNFSRIWDYEKISPNPIMPESEDIYSKSAQIYALGYDWNEPGLGERFVEAIEDELIYELVNGHDFSLGENFVKAVKAFYRGTWWEQLFAGFTWNDAIQSIYKDKVYQNQCELINILHKDPFLKAEGVIPQQKAPLSNPIIFSWINKIYQDYKLKVRILVTFSLMAGAAIGLPIIILKLTLAMQAVSSIGLVFFLFAGCGLLILDYIRCSSSSNTAEREKLAQKLVENDWLKIVEGTAKDLDISVRPSLITTKPKQPSVPQDAVLKRQVKRMIPEEDDSIHDHKHDGSPDSESLLPTSRLSDGAQMPRHYAAGTGLQEKTDAEGLQSTPRTVSKHDDSEPVRRVRMTTANNVSRFTAPGLSIFQRKNSDPLTPPRQRS